MTVIFMNENWYMVVTTLTSDGGDDDDGDGDFYWFVKLLIRKYQYDGEIDNN